MSLGKAIGEMPPYELLNFDKMTDEQKIDYQLAEMKRPKVIYRNTGSSYSSGDTFGLAGGLLLGSMLF